MEACAFPGHRGEQTWHSEYDMARAFGETLWFMTSLIGLSSSLSWLRHNNVFR